MTRKTRIQLLQVSLLFVALCHLASCAKHYKTDNHRVDRFHYRKGGRSW